MELDHVHVLDPEAGALVDLPGRRRTLTLAEVEVTSGGRNVAPQGKATQSSTANNGTADKAIDGNKSGSYFDGGQTHTEERSRDPWWELDLGAEQPIESIAIYNRTGDFAPQPMVALIDRSLQQTHRETEFQGAQPD